MRLPTTKNIIFILIVVFVIVISLGIWNAFKITYLNSKSLFNLKREFVIAQEIAEGWDPTAVLYNIISTRSKTENIDYFVFGSYFTKTYKVVFDKDTAKVIFKGKIDTKIKEEFDPLLLNSINQSPDLLYRITRKVFKEPLEDFTITYYQKKEEPCYMITVNKNGEDIKFPPANAGGGEDWQCY